MMFKRYKRWKKRRLKKKRIALMKIDAKRYVKAMGLPEGLFDDHHMEILYTVVEHYEQEYDKKWEAGGRDFEHFFTRDPTPEEIFYADPEWQIFRNAVKKEMDKSIEPWPEADIGKAWYVTKPSNEDK